MSIDPPTSIAVSVICPICQKKCMMLCWDEDHGYEVMCGGFFPGEVGCGLRWTEFPARKLFVYRVGNGSPLDIGVVRADSEEDALGMLRYYLKEVGIEESEPVHIHEIEDASTSGGVLSVIDKATQQARQSQRAYLRDTGFMKPLPPKT